VATNHPAFFPQLVNSAMPKIKTYTISCICSNCDFSGSVELKCGQLATSVSEQECPNCGCKTLRKANKSTDIDLLHRREIHPWRNPPHLPLIQTDYPPDYPSPAHPDLSPKVWCQTPFATCSLQQHEVKALGKSPKLDGAIVGKVFEQALDSWLL
jgi:hypothetical protein